MQFLKVHGLGNDFVLVDLRNRDTPSNLPELARRICHRHLGIGADGLVLLVNSDKADVRMRIFNPDGSEAQMCGNAIRCVARYLYERLQQPAVRVQTLAGIIQPQVIVKGGQVSAVKVDMGEPRLKREEIPMLGPPGYVVDEPLVVNEVTCKITAVSMGNPHCLIYVPDVGQVLLTELGPKIEHHPVFPQRTNVEFIQVLNPSEIKMRVWERGVGPTLACGTGACAAVVGSVLNGFTERSVTVHLELGDLFIEWADNNHVYMTGPAEEVFCGDFPYFK